jgi:rRNA maturation protein Nop10
MKELFMNGFNTLQKSVKFESIVLFLYLVKCLTISVAYEDALVFVALCALSGYKTHCARFERDSVEDKYKKQTEEELKTLKHSLSVLTTFTGAPKQMPQEGKRYF